MLGGEPAGCADAVKHGHVQVEQDRVGPVLGHQLQRLLAVRGGADHVDAGQAAEQQDQALADAGLGVGDDEAQRLVSGHPAIPSSAAASPSVVPSSPSLVPSSPSLPPSSASLVPSSPSLPPASPSLALVVPLLASVSGSSAVTAHSLSPGPASSVPFSSRSRSRMPVSPYPPVLPGPRTVVPAPSGIRAPAPSRPLTTVSRTSLSPKARRTATVWPGACLAALTIASCAVRSSASVASGGSLLAAPE